VVVGPKADRMKLEKHLNAVLPVKEVMVWMVALPSETSTEVTLSSDIKYTATEVE
jgi:hypothetical protein